MIYSPYLFFFKQRIRSLFAVLKYISVLLLLFLPLVQLSAQPMEEVTVEAIKKDDTETIDISASVKTFDLDELETNQVEGFGDIENLVPGLTASASGSQGLRFTIRGIGARDNQLGVESRVALYINGAFLGRSTGVVFDLVDLENVEVFKGPVGVRGGRNAVGGSINLITAKAKTDEFEARLRLGAGNFDMRKASGIINVPITDQFAVRLGYVKNIQEGWVKNNGQGVDFNGFDRESMRVSASYLPTDAVNIYYSFDWTDATNQPVYNQPVPFSDGTINERAFVQVRSGVPALLLDPVSRRRLNQTSATVATENSTTEGLGHSLNIEYLWAEEHQLEFISSYRELDVVDTFAFYPNFRKESLNAFAAFPDFAGPVNFGLVSGAGTAGFNGFILDNGESTLAIEEWARFLVPNIFSPPVLSLDTILQSPAGGINALENHQQFSFEIKQSGSFLDGRLEYLAGLYHFNERTGNSPNSSQWLDAVELFSTLPFDPFLADGASLPNSLGFSALGRNRLNTKAYAVFSDWRYTPKWLNERLHFTLGGRWTRDEREVSRAPLTAFTLDPRRVITNGASLAELERTTVTLNDSDAWESFDPRAKLEYDVTESAMLYLSYTEAFRSGSFNVLVRDNSEATLKFEEESITAWEVGFKGSLFNDIWQLEAAAYYYQQDDAQQTVLNNTTPLIRAVTNADAHAIGFEFNQKFLLTEELTLTVDYGYLESKSDEYTNPFVISFPDVAPLDINNIGDLQGVFSPLANRTPQQLAVQGIDGGDAPFINRLIRACQNQNERIDFESGSCQQRKENFGSPRSSVFVSLDHSRETTWGNRTMHVGYSYTDSYFVGDDVKLTDRHLFDARLSFAMDLDNAVAKVSLWSQNLFDHEYTVQENALEVIQDVAVYGTPRTFGIEVGYDW